MVWNPFKKNNASKAIPFQGTQTNAIRRIFTINTNQPIWINTTTMLEIAKIFNTNPVLYSVITTGANYLANGKVNLKNIKTGEIITRDNVLLNQSLKSNNIITKSFDLFDHPNPLFSRWEFLTNYLVTKWLFGNAFIYGNSPLERFDITTVGTMWNVWPQYMSAVLTGKYFSATNTNDIIKEWVWGLNGLGTNTKWKPEEILHRKDVNISIDRQEDIVFGRSRVEALNRPLSNISLAYEGENNVLNNMGARFIVTAGKDDAGVVPIGPTEKKNIQAAFDEYGLKDNQKQALIAEGVVNVTTVDQDIRKLGIFETIATDAMSIANAYKIAHDVVRYNLTGSTFENQEQAEKRTYQNAIIPEFNDFINDLNDWLKLRNYGWEYVPDWSHISVLQEDKREQASANSLINKSMMEAFNRGAITYNTWLNAIGLPDDKQIGDNRIWDLTPEQLSALGINMNKSSNLE